MRVWRQMVWSPLQLLELRFLPEQTRIRWLEMWYYKQTYSRCGCLLHIYIHIEVAVGVYVTSHFCFTWMWRRHSDRDMIEMNSNVRTLLSVERSFITKRTDCPKGVCRIRQVSVCEYVKSLQQRASEQINQIRRFL